MKKPGDNQQFNKSEDPKGQEIDRLEEQESPLARRALFGAGVAGVMSALLQACSGSDFAGGTLGGGKKKGDNVSDGDAGDGDSADGPETETDVDCSLIEDESERKKCEEGGDLFGSDGGNDDGGTPPSFDSDKDLEDCKANNTNALNLDNAPDASNDIVPDIVFYGKKTGSSMIAFQFTTTKVVESVTLTMDDGRLIAYHRLTGGDRDGTSYRAIHVDNVFLSNTSKVKFLIKIAAEDKAYLHEATVSYLDTYKGKPVLDYSNHTIPTGFTMDKQSVTQFSATANGNNFNEDANTTYPAADGTPGARTLLTAKVGTTWSPGTGIKGDVTDIMGNPINMSGSAITKYQTFVTYVLDSATDSYCRTIMKIG